MKGLVFTEFLEIVEDKFGYDVADEIIDECQLDSNGAYTQVGVYDHRELLALVTALSKKTGASIEDLVHVFGEHLIDRFTKKFPQYFAAVDNCFDFFDTVDGTVHVEVKKLYPDAELPVFETLSKTQGTMQMLYTSSRPFSALAYGMMMGTAKVFNEKINIKTEDFSDESGVKVKFTLTKNG